MKNHLNRRPMRGRRGQEPFSACRIDDPARLCRRKRSLTPFSVALAVLVLAVGGCTPARYARQADRSAYRALERKQRLALGAEKGFSVEYGPYAQTQRKDGQPLLSGKEIPLGDHGRRVLTLEECRALAFHNSRIFQNRKESLYTAALALANAEHQWSLLSGFITGEVEHTKINDGKEINSGLGEFGVSFARRFAQGGRASLGLGLQVASDLVGTRSTTLGSLLEANVTQPLLRGAWDDLAYEDLYRQERDLAIAVLAYERFRQSFSADITTSYYQVLRQLDQLANERASITRLEQALRRTRVQVEEGQVSRIQQDQTEQNLLNARVQYLRFQRQYRNALDNFKLMLGLPIHANVELAPAELVGLNAAGPASMPFVNEQAISEAVARAAREAENDLARRAPGADASDVEKRAWQRAQTEVVRRRKALALERARGKALKRAEEKAVEVAMHTRPDVLTEMARVRDARRNVDIAVNQFLPGVDLALALSAAGTEPRKPWRMQFHHHTRSAGLSLDYSLDQTNNRDAYRLAKIAVARAERDYQEFVDRVRLEVRQAYRQLMETRQTYDFQMRNVTVARRRRLLASLEQSSGRASARDVLEAEEGLRDAQNGLTGALVSYETTRVQFLAVLGLLDVDENGKPRERTTPRRFNKRMGELYGNLGKSDS